MFNVTKRALPAVLTAAVVLMLPRAAEAGPPLICHAFDAGSSPVLPWARGDGWNNPERSYDIQRLTADTLRLLSPDAPILARMENMRRATIYAAQNPRVADALLQAVFARAKAAPEGGAKTLAQFDAGYLIESYRQWNLLSGPEASAWALRDAPKGLDGYAMVKKALEMGPNPEMEFAASLMKEGSVSADHRRRAQAGATAGSLLATNLRKLAEAK